MAKRRMFSLDVVGTDEFMDMPASSQALYFHLSIRADDEGYVGCARSTQRAIGASADDLKILAMKGYIKVFDSGVVLITHWKLNNLIRSDRFTPTVYQQEKALIEGVITCPV